MMRPRWPVEDYWRREYEPVPAYPGPEYEAYPDMDYPVEGGAGWGWE
jgi:hypothetical protein